LHDGTERFLEEVRFVSNLKHDLISLGEFENKGYVFKEERGMLNVEEIHGSNEGYEEEWPVCLKRCCSV